MEEVVESNSNTYGIPDEVLDYLEKMSSKKVRTSEQRALAIMLELVKSNNSLFLLLRDDDIGKWWGKKVSIAEQRIESNKKMIRDYNLKVAAYERLEPHERKALGIRKPTKPTIFVEDGE